MNNNFKIIFGGIVIFLFGVFVGSNIDLFEEQSDALSQFEDEDILRILYPNNCIDENSGLNCKNLFDGLTTTWQTNNESCVNSTIQISFSSPQLIEFITIGEAVNMTSNNVKELQISGDFETKVFELNSEDQYLEWLDLYESVNSLEITISSLYENPATSQDCGVEEINFYGRDA